MEGSFAQATRLGLKRARWRGQWRVQIQDYLIAIVQNIELLIAHARPKPRVALVLAQPKRANYVWLTIANLLGRVCDFSWAYPTDASTPC
jgi:hypothetical protein